MTENRSRDDRNRKAHELIDSFAEKLLALNEGRDIPKSWKGRLLKALQPSGAEPGRPRDEERDTRLVADYLRAGLSRNPAVTMALNVTPDEEPPPRGTVPSLATKYGIDATTVRRVIKRALEDDPQLLLEAQKLVSSDDWDDELG